MRKFFLVAVAGLVILTATPVLAAGSLNKLPTKLTYTKEWLNVNVFSWRSSSKIKTLDRYAFVRAANIETVKDQPSQIAEYSRRYANLKTKENNLLEKKKLSSDIVNLIQMNTLDQQRILSQVRQSLTDQNSKTALASLQEQVTNQIENTLASKVGGAAATDFKNNVVAAWRDPKGESTNEKGTRVYAVGTTADNNNINNGVIIDGGQAQITEQNGQLKIEYAPGTGQNSVTTAKGEKIWKIVQSDGTTIDSYTAASQVVIGGNTGVTSNIVVKTVSDQSTATSAQNVIAGSNGTAASVDVNNIKVVGGLPVSQTGQVPMESGGPATDPGQTITNSTNSLNSLNSTSSVSQSGSDSNSSQVEQAAPQPMLTPGTSN